MISGTTLPICVAHFTPPVRKVWLDLLLETVRSAPLPLLSSNPLSFASTKSRLSYGVITELALIEKRAPPWRPNVHILTSG